MRDIGRIVDWLSTGSRSLGSLMLGSLVAMGGDEFDHGMSGVYGGLGATPQLFTTALS